MEKQAAIKGVPDIEREQVKLARVYGTRLSNVNFTVCSAPLVVRRCFTDFGVHTDPSTAPLLERPCPRLRVMCEYCVLDFARGPDCALHAMKLDLVGEQCGMVCIVRRFGAWNMCMCSRAPLPESRRIQ